MDSLEELKRNWEGFAQTDPLWAICTDSTKKEQQWNLVDFFLTGEMEIETVLNYIKSLGLSLNYKEPALDFGCGVGRLTQAISNYFDSCYGIDISPTMIKTANEFNKYPVKCHYLVNDSEKLSVFEDNYFSFIYTSIVLQHIQPRYIESYLKEFIRVLRPEGVLIFQIPDSYNKPVEIFEDISEERSAKKFIEILRAKLAIRTRLKKLLISHHEELKEEPKDYLMEMNCVPESIVSNIIETTGSSIIDVRLTNSTDPDFNGRLKYLESEPEQGYISKQYCVIKRMPHKGDND